MTTITHTYVPSQGSNTTLATYTYAYNAASEVTSESHADGTLTYTYDNTGQLTGVDGSGGSCGATGCDESFSYDVNGNRTMTGHTTGTGNRLTSDGTYNYTYDDNGNMLTKTRISDGQKYEFTWDYRNRLTQVLLKTSGGTILQQTDYTYDGFDRRIIKTHDPDGPGAQPATTTKTIFDAMQPPTAEQIATEIPYTSAVFAANPYSDFDGSNNLTMRYLYGNAIDLLLARRNASGTAAWYLADHLGTIRDVVNITGTILDHISYSTFGTITAESSPSNGDRFKFTGREYESETGLDYYRARTYDPSTGRFVSQDPIGFAAGDANLYRYVNNQPVMQTDPLGLNPDPDKLMMGRGGGTWVAGMSAGYGKSYDETVESLKAGLAAGAVAAFAVADFFIPYDEIFDAVLGAVRIGRRLKVVQNVVTVLTESRVTKNIPIGCFVAGTPIATDRGAMPIEQITAGDFVVAAEPVALATGAILTSSSEGSSDDTETATFDWRYLWFGAGVVLAMCLVVNRNRRRGCDVTACDPHQPDLEEPHPIPARLSRDTARGCQAVRNENRFSGNTSSKVVGKRPRSANSTTANPRARFGGRAAHRFLAAAATFLAVLGGMFFWSSTVEADKQENPLSHGAMAPVAQSVMDPSQPYRVLHYAYVEPGGQATASWLVADDQLIDLLDGSTCTVGELEPGDKIDLTYGFVGTVESLSSPFIPRAPPSDVELGNNTGLHRVVGTVEHSVDTLVDLHYAGETVSTTQDHPFWEVGRGDWVPAVLLQAGDQLLSADGPVLRIESVTLRHGRFTVYNLEVEGVHNYFAGFNRVLVHNNPCAAVPKIHGNSMKWPGVSYLYKLVDVGNNVLKYGISNDPAHRYTAKQLKQYGAKPPIVMVAGRRAYVRALEKHLNATQMPPLVVNP